MVSSSLTPWRALGPALLASTALLAACGTTSSAATPSRTVTVTRTPTDAATDASTSASAAPLTPQPTGPQPCPTRSLAVRAGLSQGATGSIYQVIDFTNISGVTCTLYGYPGVAFAGGSPVKQIGVAADENPATPRRLVTLTPGAIANALLRIVQAADYLASKCHPVAASSLQIYPPNQTTPIYLSYSSQACSTSVHLLTVDVVKAGSGG